MKSKLQKIILCLFLLCCGNDSNLLIVFYVQIMPD
ncbi:serine/threonine-protein phosphatase 2, partial [Shigella dysenteriae]